ncbi:MAG: hypothetical protein ACYTGB_06180 [Planctomycetota bacterium]|jgi:hypothetical protein
MRIVTALTVLFLAAGMARGADFGDPAPQDRPLPAEEADMIARRVGEAALVVVAVPIKVWDKGVAECRVLSVLKGKYDDLTFRVRFVKVLGGVWPQRGVSAVYFLRPPVGGRTSILNNRTVFDLTSDKTGLAPPTAPLIAVARLAAAGRYTRFAERRRLAIKLPPPESKLGTMLSARYVAIGTIEEVHLSKQPLVAARLSCRLESVVKGKLQPGRLEIALPKGVGDDPKLKPLAVKAGPAVLMFVKAGNRDAFGEFRMVSPYRGWFEIESREDMAAEFTKLADLVNEEKELRRSGLVGDPAERTTVRKTLQLWQTSWNAKEVQNVISCYSHKSKWRRLWESGGKDRREIVSTIEEYPANFFVSLEGIEEKKGAREVLVRVSINVVTADEIVERRPAVMTFVYENGMWLILREGT